MSTLPRGQRLIPTVIDDYAQSQPDRIYGSHPCDQDDLSKGFKDVTSLQVAKAIDAASLWLDETLGKSDGSFETFIYLGARDLRYAIMAVAAAKTGRAALFPSLFGSMESHVFLAGKTKAQHILYSDELETLAHEIHVNYPNAPTFRVPKQSHWLNDDNTSIPHYPYTKTFEEAEFDPVFIVHTSGTTGLPKPVVYTNGHISTFDRYFDMPTIDGRRINLSRARCGRNYNSLPVFHVFGLVNSLVFVVFTDVITVLGPANKAPTKEIAEAVLDYSGITSATFSPFLLEVLGRDHRTMAKLKNLEHICFGGAQLCTPVGDELAHSPGVALVNGMGTTEAGGYLTSEIDDEDWQWFDFYPCMGFELEDTGDEEHYELVAHRSPVSEQYTNFWRTSPIETVIHTKDLFSPHPTKKGLWRYRCRLDDLILLTGEIKLYCRTIEEAVGDHPTVSGVLVGGDRRNRPFMLLELVQDESGDPEQTIDAVWETVEKENARNAPSARIKRDMTIVMTGEKFLVRSPKGSIERRKTFGKYEGDINRLYGGPIGAESIKRHDSARGFTDERVPGTEDIDRES